MKSNSTDVGVGGRNGSVGGNKRSVDKRGGVNDRSVDGGVRGGDRGGGDHGGGAVADDGTRRGAGSSHSHQSEQCNLKSHGKLKNWPK